MVRLKEIRLTSAKETFIDFNSVMVRLKECKSVRLSQTGQTFQFRNGSIKRKLRNEFEVKFENFNSVMVRLKECPESSL